MLSNENEAIFFPWWETRSLVLYAIATVSFRYFIITRFFKPHASRLSTVG